MIPIITFDGPSGVGKGTIAALIAKQLKWNLLDSGLIYRSLVFLAAKKKINLDDVDSLVKLANNMNISFTTNEDQTASSVIYQGQPIENMLRSENIGIQTAKIATIIEVREALIQRQRDFKQPPGLVADGRDMGTFIFPEADIKFFITANAEERAKRRYKQLQENNLNVNMSDLLLKINSRDESDSKRAASPLKPADDAYLIDSSELSVEEVLTTVVNVLQTNGLSPK